MKSKGSMINRTAYQKVVFWIVFGLFVLYSIGLLYPYLYAFNAALKANGPTFDNDPVSISWKPNFMNFVNAFTELNCNGHGFLEMTANSLWYSFGGTIMTLFSSAMCAYVVAKYKFFGKTFIYTLSIIVLIIPVYGALPAKYSLLYDMHMLDSPLYLISMASAFGFNFLIIYSFFSMISWEYAESAFIDGANDYTVFFRIMLPLAFPSMTAIGIMSFVGLWNDYEAPLIFLREMPTLASGMWWYQKSMIRESNMPVYFAGALLSLVPVLIIYGVFQNTIMQNVYTGGLKN